MTNLIGKDELDTRRAMRDGAKAGQEKKYSSFVERVRALWPAAEAKVKLLAHAEGKLKRLLDEMRAQHGADFVIEQLWDRLNDEVTAKEQADVELP